MDSGLWRAMLEGYGQRVTLRRGGESREIRAFFQPIREKGPGGEPTPLGIAPAGRWLYLGPPQEELTGEEELLWQGRAFRAVRRREIPMGEEPFYRWAIFEEQDEVSR